MAVGDAGLAGPVLTAEPQGPERDFRERHDQSGILKRPLWAALWSGSYEEKCRRERESYRRTREGMRGTGGDRLETHFGEKMQRTR